MKPFRAQHIKNEAAEIIIIEWLPNDNQFFIANEELMLTRMNIGTLMTSYKFKEFVDV
jgi:hypothetical protein